MYLHVSQETGPRGLFPLCYSVGHWSCLHSHVCTPIIPGQNIATHLSLASSLGHSLQHKSNCVTQWQKLHPNHLSGPVPSLKKVLHLWLLNTWKLQHNNIIDVHGLVLWPSSIILQTSELRNKLGRIHKFPVRDHSMSAKVFVIYNLNFMLFSGSLTALLLHLWFPVAQLGCAITSLHSDLPRDASGCDKSPSHRK